jgi:hypothetical protein
VVDLDVVLDKDEFELKIANVVTTVAKQMQVIA